MVPRNDVRYPGLPAFIIQDYGISSCRHHPLRLWISSRLHFRVPLGSQRGSRFNGLRHLGKPSARSENRAGPSSDERTRLVAIRH
eukprot:7930995-Pyramimonas_sp.AAC.1